MTIGFLFWLLMVLWFVFSIVGRLAPDRVPWSPFVNDVFLFILFFLIGWKVFGFVIHASRLAPALA
jgi:hypothetical protein